ncbi:MAG: Inosose dehydratase [Firmicutes bacterium ADurb.Bin193]|nr:MAG: Inosose dehydratase [Firmicutes bacterium ADurb.Bin193]
MVKRGVKMKVAAQMYTVRNFARTPEEIRESLRKVKEIGYNYFQNSGLGEIDPYLLKDYADEFGLGMCATHVFFDRITQDTENVIKEHKIWNSKHVSLPAMPQQFRGSTDGVKAFIKEIMPAAIKIREAGLKLSYHNHRFEFEKSGGRTFYEQLAESTDPEFLGLLVDVYWVQSGGASPSLLIKKYAERIDVIHLKDMAVKNNEPIMAEVGRGNIDWLEIKKVCEESGVEYAAVEQDICESDPFDSLKISFDYIKEMEICTI